MVSGHHSETMARCRPTLTRTVRLMTNRIRVVATMALGALLLAPVALAADVTRHRVPGQPISFTTPASWRVATTSPYVVVDPVRSSEFNSNVNVVVEPVPAGTPLARYGDALVAQIRTIHAGAIGRTTVKLPAGQAIRLAYTPTLAAGTVRKKVSTLQYCFVRGRKGFVVTYTTLPALATAYRTRFLRSARSIRFN